MADPAAAAAPGGGRQLTIPRDFANERECRVPRSCRRLRLHPAPPRLTCPALPFYIFPISPPSGPCAFAVRAMMYGFGDEPQPRRDSIKLMQDLVIEYISGLIAKVRAATRFCRHESVFLPRRGGER